MRRLITALRCAWLKARLHANAIHIADIERARLALAHASELTVEDIIRNNERHLAALDKRADLLAELIMLKAGRSAKRRALA